MHFFRHTYTEYHDHVNAYLYDKERSYIIPNPNDNYKVMTDLFFIVIDLGQFTDSRTTF